MSETQVITVHEEAKAEAPIITLGDQPVVETAATEVAKEVEVTNTGTRETVETTANTAFELTDEMIEAKYGFKPSEYENLKKERDELVNANPYRSEEARQVDELISGGMSFDAALEFIRLDVSKLTPMEKIILHQKQAIKGEFSDQEIIDYINNDLLESYDPEEKLTIKQQSKLQQLEKEAEAFIEQKKSSLKSDAPSRSSLVEERQNLERIKEWGSTIPKIAETKMEFTFGDKEKPLKVNFDLNEQDKKDLQEALKTYTETYDVSATNAEHKANLEVYARNFVLLKNADKMLNLAYKQGLSHKTKEMIQKEENPDFGTTRKVASREGQQITIHS